MSSPLHILDPDGDVDLIIDEQSAPLLDASELTGKASQTTVAVTTPGNEAQNHGNTEPSSESSTRMSAGDSQKASNEPDVLVVRASSKHLALASQYFKTLLHGRFKESKDLSDNGRVQTRVPQSSYSREALLLFLNAVHGSTERISHQIEFSLYLELAVLINFFDANATKFKFYTDIWDEGHEYLLAVPKNTTWAELKQIACVAWVFKKSEVFEDVTRELIMRCDSRKIEFGSIPFPASVIAGIEMERKRLLRIAFNGFYGVLHDPEYRAKELDSVCSSTDPAFKHSCTALRIGFLMMALQEKGWLSWALKEDSVSPEAFEGSIRSLKAWMVSIEEKQSLEKTEKSIFATDGSGKHPVVLEHKCKLRDWMWHLNWAIEDGIKGLKLSDYQHGQAQVEVAPTNGSQHSST